MATDTAELSSSTKFNWMIQNFSKLNPKDGTYSDVFSVGGFKWKAHIYPKGVSRVHDQDHLSLYVRPVFLTKCLDIECSLAVTSQTYPSIITKRELKEEVPETWPGWGWASFMPLNELNDPEKGYIMNDTCVITIEMTCTTKEPKDVDDVNETNPNKVAKTKEEKQTNEKAGLNEGKPNKVIAKIEKGKNVADLSSTKFNWKIENFSKLNAKDGFICSDAFSVGGSWWEARIYPKGRREHDHISLYLCPVFLTSSVDTEFTFAVASQTYPSIKMKREGKRTFHKKSKGRGWQKFLRHSELHDPEKGYIVNDTCVVTIEVTCTTKESKDDDDVIEGMASKVITKTKTEKQIAKEKNESSSLSGKYQRARLSEFFCCFPFCFFMKFFSD